MSCVIGSCLLVADVEDRFLIACLIQALLLVKTIQPTPRLLGDIGGTNARFGWQAEEGGEIEHVRVLPCAEHAGLFEAIEAYLKQIGLPTPACAALGMAVTVTGDAVAMTNHHWKFSVGDVRERLGLQRLLVLNDFTALALALPHLPASSRWSVGAGFSSVGFGAHRADWPGHGAGGVGLDAAAWPGVLGADCG